MKGTITFNLVSYLLLSPNHNLQIRNCDLRFCQLHRNHTCDSQRDNLM